MKAKRILLAFSQRVLQASRFSNIPSPSRIPRETYIRLDKVKQAPRAPIIISKVNTFNRPNSEFVYLIASLAVTGI